MIVMGKFIHFQLRVKNTGGGDSTYESGGDARRLA